MSEADCHKRQANTPLPTAFDITEGNFPLID